MELIAGEELLQESWREFVDSADLMLADTLYDIEQIVSQSNVNLN